jgi:hypothetical protein
MLGRRVSSFRHPVAREFWCGKIAIMDIACVSPEKARRYLSPVEPKWRAFWFHMHYMVDDLEGFARGLSEISEEVFDYHFRAHDNDFARWVQEVIGDATLAEALRAAEDREQVIALSRQRLTEIKAVLAAEDK